MEQTFWVLKDEEGVLRPTACIMPAYGAIGKASKEEWDINLSKKKHFRGSTIVKCIVTEIQE